MTKRIHNAILIVSIITFFCSILVIVGVSFPYFNEEIRSEVISEAVYLCAGTEIGGKEYLESFREHHRITLIDTDGSVIYDTVSDTYELENHKDREEVAEALETGEGESYRYSSTLTKKTYYYAKRLSNGTVLRVSDEQMTIGALILRLIMPLFAALLAVIIISAILSSSIAKKIVKPINELDFHDPVIKGDYSEISPLLRRISRQNTLIELQMKELKRQQEEFLTVTGNMSEGLILIDSKAEVLSYNKSALRLLGVDDKGVGSGILAFCDSPELIRVVESVLNGVSCEPVISINGKELNILANPVSDEKKVSGAVLLILDVTERERRDTLRREFTSNVSHELKTPLTSIYGISDMMQNGLIRPEDTAQFAKNIHDETGRLITLVNDIIKLSQLDEGAVGLETEEVDLLACAKTVRTSLSAVAQRQGVTLSVQGESAFVTGIGTVIGEMIYNLCDNGIKYNREGGSVTVTVESIEGHPTVTVADTGIGIPKEHQERIFERFYRVDKSHSRSIGGTGLGLSIVKHGAAVHNATVRLESTEGEGTTVSIVF